eukprot:1353193-Amorphochlora_amoeboformis.AAC.1
MTRRLKSSVHGLDGELALVLRFLMRGKGRGREEERREGEGGRREGEKERERWREGRRKGMGEWEGEKRGRCYMRPSTRLSYLYELHSLLLR